MTSKQTTFLKYVTSIFWTNINVSKMESLPTFFHGISQSCETERRFKAKVY